ncbi:MAG TPA: GNAT family N-acetyltransferase [Pyrinomonadaceae bacterium]|nr:GNAT family N-acetyltransferase [Pyrinomonadaceae bacterium]
MPTAENLNPPVLLTKDHDRNAFDCGVSALNDYLKRYALQNQKKHAARTYVATRGNRIVGYYSLAYGSVSLEEAPQSVTAGLPKHPVPVILLARLAVDSTEQRRGLGATLLKDALLRTIQAAEIAGLRAMLVHAKDDSAKRFYEKFGFEPSPIDAYHLFLRLSDILASLR